MLVLPDEEVRQIFRECANRVPHNKDAEITWETPLVKVFPDGEDLFSFLLELEQIFGVSLVTNLEDWFPTDEIVADVRARYPKHRQVLADRYPHINWKGLTAKTKVDSLVDFHALHRYLAGDR